MIRTSQFGNAGRSQVSTHSIDSLDGLVKSIGSCNVWHNGQGELVWVLGVCLLDFGGRALRSYRSAHVVTSLQKSVRDVSSDEARGAGDEDRFGHWNVVGGICWVWVEVLCILLARGLDGDGISG